MLAGAISLAIFVTAMIGGGITFIDDKARGLHEGYLTTPLTKADLVMGLIGAGAVKGLMAGLIITFIGGLLAGIPRLWEPMRLFYLIVVLSVTSLTMISFMFLLMVRVSDPLVPRAIFGVLNTLLFFPSGAIYPTAGFPLWLRWISAVDPFTFAVDALKKLLLKDTGFVGISLDVAVLAGLSLALITGCIIAVQTPGLKVRRPVGSSRSITAKNPGDQTHKKFNQKRKAWLKKMRRFTSKGSADPALWESPPRFSYSPRAASPSLAARLRRKHAPHAASALGAKWPERRSGGHGIAGSQHHHQRECH